MKRCHLLERELFTLVKEQQQQKSCNKGENRAWFRVFLSVEGLFWLQFFCSWQQSPFYTFQSLVALTGFGMVYPLFKAILKLYVRHSIHHCKSCAFLTLSKTSSCLRNILIPTIHKLCHSCFFIAVKRRSNCVKEVERLKKNREERRQAERPYSYTSQALILQHCTESNS